MHTIQKASVALTVCLMTVFGVQANNDLQRTTPTPVKSRVVNVNPDPNGPAWYAGGIADELTAKELEKLESLPLLDFSNRRTPLPSKLNNAVHKYFPPVIRQQGGSCAQASGVGYQFTYEVNLEQNTSATILQNQFPSHYTWNFLNEGNGGGSNYTDGWDIIRANGCPSLAVFGGMTGNDLTDTKWMTGYEKYLSGMNRRVTSISRIKITTVEGLTTLKRWLLD
ncbi:MAG: hypothetical protein JW795_06380, partial [Chitinivibrionales bacterium]|nr:hypothetical protein [Chitinivibrionales bacterium]